MTLRYDDFDRGDSASSIGSPSDGGSAYTVTGTWGITGNKAYCPNPSGSGSLGAAVLDTGSADMDQSVTFAGPIVSSAQGLVIRYVSATDYWIVRNVSNVWKLSLWAFGSYFDDPNTYAAAASPGDVVRCTVTGSATGAFKVYINGTLRITSSQFETFEATGTYSGLFVSFDTTTTFDNFGPPPGGTLTAGTLAVTAHNSDSISLSLATNTGGTPPYSNQLQRAPDVAGSPGSFVNDGSPVAGATPVFTSSALAGSTIYWYQVVVTDNVSATATSNQVSQQTNAPDTAELHGTPFGTSGRRQMSQLLSP